MIDEIRQQAKNLNGRCKQAARHLKDRFVPWRKKRREQMVHLGNQVLMLQSQLAQAHQSLAATDQAIAGLENRQLSSNHLRALNELVQQSERPAIQMAFERCTEKMNTQIGQVAERQATAVALLTQQQSALEQYLQQHLDQLGQATSELAQLAQRLESRLFELEQQTQGIQESARFHQPFLDSIQSRITALEQQTVSAEIRINEITTQLQPCTPSEAPRSIEPPVQPVPSLISSRPPAVDYSHTPKGMKASSVVARESRSNLPRPPSRFGSDAYDYYSQLNDAPFVYLDVKSVPRSGLHYLQRTLKDILGKSLSFCEWYQEPGCCKQMPCALTGFAKACCQQQSCGVRMIKSHDFDLADPIFPSGEVLRRIVLIRDPIFCLTSYWNLQSLKHNQELLTAHGIHPVKVDYLHEPPVLEMAYQLIDAKGSVPKEANLEQWLAETKKYMLGFITKWGRHVPAESVIPYEKVNDFALELVESMAEKLSAQANERLQTWKVQRTQHFASRSSPFQSGSQRLSEYLVQHAARFQQCAQEIRQADPTGWFLRCSQIEANSKDGQTDAGLSQLRAAG